MTPYQASMNWSFVGALCLLGVVSGGHHGLHDPWVWATITWTLVSFPLAGMKTRYERGYR